ncbi:MAG: proteasome activator [Candidatus Nanopelagicales bacterium]
MVGPDGQPIGVLAAPRRHGRRRERHVGGRHGRAAREGHAHRHDDQAPSRRCATRRSTRPRGPASPTSTAASSPSLESGLAPELVEELERLSLPFTDDRVPSESELRIAQAQLVGWLEGLFHGIQTALFAQQMAAQAQLEQMRRRALGPGAGPGMPGAPADPGAGPGEAGTDRGGLYL